jgi:acyl-CoA dehydrogenase
MLMTMRAFNEAARALVMWTALQSDVAHRAGEPAARQAADDHMALLTPVIKGVLTDRGFANTVLAQQIYGGHGYIAEHGMEQFVRDARIAMLYEGANGIQALDLVGRKLALDNGRALQGFLGEVQDYIARHGDATMKPYVGPLATALGHLQQATMWLMRNASAKPDDAAAGATDYMHLMGLVVLGYMWCRLVEAAMARLAADAAPQRMRDKLVTGRFFVERMLPETAVHLARIRAGAASVMELPAEAF